MQAREAASISNESGLKRAIHHSGAVRPVHELKNQGIRSIRVLSESQLADLMRVAVNRALRDQLDGLELPAPVIQALRERTEEEYGRLLEEGLENQNRPRPEGWKDFLEHEETAVRSLVSDEPGPAPQFQISPSSEEFREFEDRMVSSLSKLLEKERRGDLEQVSASQGEKIDVLEKRISKLVRALEATDRVLHHIQSTGGAAPDAAPASDGLGSGLDPDGPLFEKKSQLLTALFQANRQLHTLADESSD